MPKSIKQINAFGLFEDGNLVHAAGYWTNMSEAGLEPYMWDLGKRVENREIRKIIISFVEETPEAL